VVNGDMHEPKPLAVVDIDGVVADVRHRLHFLQTRPKNWEQFFAAARTDPPHPEGLELVVRLAEDHEIVFVSGRPERLRQDTMEWLATHGLGTHRLLMRADDDRRPAAQVKREIVSALAREQSIDVVVDDDPFVLSALRAAGHPTIAAEWEHRLPEDEQAIVEAREVEGQT
jgi:hypothetical protein